MKSSTHMAIALTTYADCLILTQTELNPLSIPVYQAFSVLPDIDIESL